MGDLLEKLHFKDVYEGVVMNAPPEIEPLFLSNGFRRSGSGEFTVLFIRDQNELDRNRRTIRGVKYDSILWICYPKKGSRLATDLDRNKMWDLLLPLGLRAVSQVAIDDTWSALRFRPIEKVKGQ